MINFLVWGPIWPRRAQGGSYATGRPAAAVQASAPGELVRISLYICSACRAQTRPRINAKTHQHNAVITATLLAANTGTSTLRPVDQLRMLGAATATHRTAEIMA